MALSTISDAVTDFFCLFGAHAALCAVSRRFAQDSPHSCAAIHLHRDTLMAGSSSNQPARETEQTAELDNRVR